MTDRLYYTDSFLHQFEARVVRLDADGGSLALDRSAFYPASGGQLSDTGWIEVPAPNGRQLRLRVKDVAEDQQTNDVIHSVEKAEVTLRAGIVVRGVIDAERRRDHMQQHSGQHVLSAAFEKLYGFPTVSFHMGDQSSTIDLASHCLEATQIDDAERLANEIISEDRPVEIRFATADEARSMGVRKIPPGKPEKLRLIDIREFDLNACGGTHVRSTGQIGGLLLRKSEKVKQGVRLEFLCGLRAVSAVRRDFQTLTDAASALSTNLWEVPQQVRKTQDELRAGQKTQHRLLEEVAELQAERLLAFAEKGAFSKPNLSTHGGLYEHPARYKLVVHFVPERDLTFIKMLAQKLTRSAHVVALLGCGGLQPSLVFAQTPGLQHDMGALMKQAVQRMGTRGGGTGDMAQGGAPDAGTAQEALRETAKAVG